MIKAAPWCSAIAAVLTPGDNGAILGQMDSPEAVYNRPVSESVARLTGPVPAQH